MSDLDNPFEILEAAECEDPDSVDLFALARNMLHAALYPCPNCDGMGRDWNTMCFSVGPNRICPECGGWGMDTSINPTQAWDNVE